MTGFRTHYLFLAGYNFKVQPNRGAKGHITQTAGVAVGACNVIITTYTRHARIDYCRTISLTVT